MRGTGWGEEGDRKRERREREEKEEGREKSIEEERREQRGDMKGCIYSIKREELTKRMIREA